jgi:predicted AAA+ superfamily ATPase
VEFKRSLDEQLLRWKADTDRKPLILRGARQVGKTTAIKKFAKSYKHTILLNLEKSAEVAYFQDFNDVKDIIYELLLSKRNPSVELPKTLIFID